MTDRELLDRKGHEVNDELPPLPEPAYLADDMHAFPAGTVAKWPQPNRDRMAHPLYTAAQVEEIRRAAVLAERERCAKECDKIGERHRKMNDSRPPELMTSGENAAYECADAIRKDAP